MDAKLFAELPADLQDLAWKLLTAKRKYRHGCLRLLPENMRVFGQRGPWAVDLGDGRAWFGKTPRLAWENFDRWAQTGHAYRGPKDGTPSHTCTAG